ncbi:flagellar biosynthetic protein FliO [Pantoea vagans]|uniref:flagellar biosynthetic protein FliO n=1 Tax=Pantoea vagans TaxID=470934 RepID=UPI003FA3791A
MLLNLSGALLLVLIAIIVTALWLRRSRWGGSLTRKNSLLNVRQSHALGQREQVVIVEVTGRWLLLGVTSGGITLLTELDKSCCEAENISHASAGNFQQLLCHLIKKTESKP